MSEQEPQPNPRRRRRRATSVAGPPLARRADDPADPIPDAIPDAIEPTRSVGGGSRTPAPAKRARKPRADTGERALHSLVGSGASQLGVSGALRGRDVNRPSEQDLAEAERELVIIRRHWRPPT